MSSVLYYSNFCAHSKKIIGKLARTMTKKEVHFICIDNRELKNGRIHIILENGARCLLPPNISKVPALLLIAEQGRVIYGDDIIRFFEPKEEFQNQKNTQNNGEPLAFSAGEMGGMSDNYAYLDLSPDELSAKGTGGTRQMHFFSALDDSENYTIETPPEDYSPDKIGQIDMGKLEMARAAEIKQH